MNDIMIKETQQLILCPIYTGRPTPRITWLKNGRRLISGEDQDINPDGSLYMPCVRKEQAGKLVNKCTSLICFSYNNFSALFLWYMNFIQRIHILKGRLLLY